MRKKLLRSRSGFEKPESREEAIMQNILGASNVLEPSESNIEEILKSILYNTPYTKEVVNEPLQKIGDYTDTISKEQAGVQIPTNNGTTVIDVDTLVKPSNIYIEYK